MTAATPAPAFTRPGPGWRYRLESLPFERLYGLGLAGLLVTASGVLRAVNLSAAPARAAAEGALVNRAWAMQHLGQLTPTTYTYDHPPLAWLQISLWTRLTGAFDRAPSAVAAGREVMVVAYLAAAVLTWLLARRLGLARWSAAIASAVFGFSPLAVTLHRQVALENVAVPWLLAAFVLACSPRRDLGAFVAAGALLGLAVLSSELALLAAPALALQLWRSTEPARRRYVLTAAGSAFGVVLGLFAADALIRGQLFPGTGPSLAEGLGRQLVGLPSTGSVFRSGTVGHDIVSDWLGLDPIGPLLGLAAAGLALVAVPRLAAPAVAFLVLAAAVVRPGHRSATLAALLLPFGAVLVAGAAEHLWVRGRATWVARRRAEAGEGPAHRATGPGAVPAAARSGPPGAVRTALALAPLAVALAAVAVAVPAWAGDDRDLLRDDLDAPERAAVSWVDANVAADREVRVPSTLWADLVERGFPPARLAGAEDLDGGPDEPVSPAGAWSGTGVAVVTAADAATDPRLRGAPTLAVFGRGANRLEVRVVSDSAGDTVPSRRRADRPHDPDAAAEAGAGLVRNPGLDLAPDARDQLIAGEVDERVMTTLVALASQEPLVVTGFPAARAELDAGLPRRAVDLTTDGEGDARELEALLDRQEPPYQPSAIEVGPDGRLAVTWELAGLP